MSVQMTLWDTAKLTSSRESGAGPSPSDLPASLTMPPSGLVPAPVSHFPLQAKAGAPPTSATFGPKCAASSRSAALQSSLESRLRAAPGLTGSPLYALTWKVWDMPSGPPICVLRGSARRISDSAFTGAPWPTPCTQDGPHGGPDQGADRLPGAAALSGWPTPISNDATGSTHCYSRGAVALKLPGAALLTGWPTPTTRDWKDGAADGTAPPNGLLGRVAWEAKGPARLTADGRTLIGSDAGMGNGGRLNPEHSRWLMGYPGAWDDCGATVMPSSRKSRRPS